MLPFPDQNLILALQNTQDKLCKCSQGRDIARQAHLQTVNRSYLCSDASRQADKYTQRHAKKSTSSFGISLCDYRLKQHLEHGRSQFVVLQAARFKEIRSRSCSSISSNEAACCWTHCKEQCASACANLLPGAMSMSRAEPLVIRDQARSRVQMRFHIRVKWAISHSCQVERPLVIRDEAKEQCSNVVHIADKRHLSADFDCVTPLCTCRVCSRVSNHITSF